MIEQNIPFGYCQCGCGQLAPIATRNRHERGQVKGQPMRYIPHHYRTEYPPLEDRLWANVHKTDTCWLWQGGKGSHGYGEINLGNKVLLTHRLSYEIHYGSIPEGFHVCHKCDVRACINPAHLFLGTPLDNMQDMKKKGRQIHDPSSYTNGEKVHTAKLKRAQVIAIRQRVASGDRQIDVARELGISTYMVWAIVHRKTWKSI